jgi:hypothetical protein
MCAVDAGRVVDADRGVGVQVGDAGGGDLIAGLADVVRAEEELSREIGDGDGGRIVEGQALDASEGNILCDLDAETLEADNQDVGGDHALHGIVAEDVELAAVEGLVDLGGLARVLGLHPGDEVDLDRLLAVGHGAFEGDGQIAVGHLALPQLVGCWEVRDRKRRNN